MCITCQILLQKYLFVLPMTKTCDIFLNILAACSLVNHQVQQCFALKMC